MLTKFPETGWCKDLTSGQKVEVIALLQKLGYREYKDSNLYKCGLAWYGDISNHQYSGVNYSNNPKYTYQDISKFLTDEKEFKLPKNWGVKITEENIKVLAEWRHENFSIPRGSIGYYITSGRNHELKNSHGMGQYMNILPTSYTEITFEEFKEHVLKEPKSTRELMPPIGKMRVTPEQSKILQEALLSEGFTWGNNEKKVQLIKSPYLYWGTVDNKIVHGTILNTFLDSKEPEYTFEQLFNQKSQTTNNGIKTKTNSYELQSTFSTESGREGSSIIRPYSGRSEVASTKGFVGNKIPHLKIKGSVRSCTLSESVLPI